MAINLVPGSREPKLKVFDPKLLTWANSLISEISPERIRAEVEALPAPRNRLHAPQEIETAQRLIIERFKRAGWQVETQPYQFSNISGYVDYDDFTKPIVYPLLEGTNILAVKKAEGSRQAIVVMAHYDTVRDSPGANDNTASVAALLELARILCPYSFSRTLILAAVDMEELNLIGAKALVAELVGKFQILGVLNYETMAYTNPAPGTQFLPPGLELIYSEQVDRIHRREDRGDFTAVIYNGPATNFAATFAAGMKHFAGADAILLLRDPNDLPLIGKLLGRTVPAVRNFARSDHARFWEAGLPAMMITDTANFRYQHYHRSTDTPEKLNYQRLADIVAASALSLAATAGLILP